MNQELDAARSAVAVAPDDCGTRLYLATLLFESGDIAAALEHFASVLGRDPANLRALEGAAQSALALGDAERAEGYFRLLAVLGGVAHSLNRPTEVSADLSPMELLGQNQPYELQKAAEAEQAEQGQALRIPAAGEDESDDDWRTERPTLTLADVAGMEAVKRRLQVAFLAPLRNPELTKMFGKSLRGGLLLFGPPGCGKTFIARATAGELEARFISIGLSDVLDMWFGESERKLHALFETARRNAPVVLFFDEVDALGQKRGQLKHQAGRNLVNQLLAELDGVDQDNQGVFVLGATNHPWDVDTALLRPGRFDRAVLVLPPDQAARAAILRYHLRDRPAPGVDLTRLATRTNDLSGADLAHLCESAAEIALEASLESGAVRPMTEADFQRALKEIRPSTRAWFEVARNYAMFANHGGFYDDLLAYMRAHRLL